MKYPNLISGAIAASAPITYFTNAYGFDDDRYMEIITKDFRDTNLSQSLTCDLKIGKTYDKIIAKELNQTYYNTFNQLFQLCTNITNSTGVTYLEDWITNALTYMAMTDYPYPTDFLSYMPGNPVNVSCHYFDNLTDS